MSDDAAEIIENECECGCGRDADECHDAWLRERRLTARIEHDAGLHPPGCLCWVPRREDGAR